jgi:hypothetical protein
VVGAVLLAISSCGDFDSQIVAVKFKNDLGREVRFSTCRDVGCHDRDRGSLVKPDATTESVVSSVEIVQSFRLTEASGQVLGCLPMSIHGKYEHIVVPFSKAEPCPGDRPLRIGDVAHGKPYTDP